MKSIIDNLPDNVLLNIFSQLDDQTIQIIPLVCKRWYYLSNTVELWLFKCKQLGKSENLGKIEAILIDELMKDEDIDWKLAYFELKEFVEEIKRTFLDKINETYGKFFKINGRDVIIVIRVRVIIKTIKSK